MPCLKHIGTLPLNIKCQLSRMDYFFMYLNKTEDA
jgi:hypothetical protein